MDRIEIWTDDRIYFFQIAEWCSDRYVRQRVGYSDHETAYRHHNGEVRRVPNRHWSEWEEYDLSDKEFPIDDKGRIIDERGGVYPIPRRQGAKP